MGGGGARARPRRGPADPALDRLRRLPLVPRDGARVVRGRGDRRADERALRQRQGRPRGAARPGCGLHGGRRRALRPRRLADDRLPHPRGRAVLRRHLLPTCTPARPAELPPGADGDRRGVARPPRRRRALLRAARRGGAALGLAPGIDRPALGRGARGRRAWAPFDLRAHPRGLGPRPEVPERAGARAAPSPRGRRGARDGALHARRDGGRWDVRPARRRLPPLLRRRPLARPALREDALRQRPARARVPARVARDRRGALPARRRGDARLHAARARAAARAVSPPRRTPTPTVSRG